MELQNLEDVICKFKEPYVLNKYNKKNNIIIKKFIEELKNRKPILIELLKKENETWGTKFNIDKIIEKIVKEYGELKEKNDKKFGIGDIIAITSGDIYLQLDLIIKAIIANCRIIFILPPILLNFNIYIVSIIQEILEGENLDKELISAVNSLVYKKIIVDNKDYIDCIIINKEYDEYSYFRDKIDSKVIYLDYGNINIYVNSEEFNNDIQRIIDKANDIEMDVYKYDISNLEEFFKKEIHNFIFNTVVIFSKDIKKCMRLYEAIKSDNIFINEFDIDHIKIGLELNELQFEKNLIIKK